MADDMKRRRQIAAAAFAARRSELELTQEEVARRGKVAKRTVGNFEAQGRWPTSVNRGKLERAVGWPVGEIQRLAEEPEPELDPELLELASRLRADQKEALVRALTRQIREQRDEGPGQSAASG